MTENELYHYGIIGQKWGVRRYQNPDGSLTDAGKKRYDKVASNQKRGEGHQKRAASMLNTNIKSLENSRKFNQKRADKEAKILEKKYTEKHAKKKFAREEMANAFERKRDEFSNLRSDIVSGKKKAGKDYMVYRGIADLRTFVMKNKNLPLNTVFGKADKIELTTSMSALMKNKLSDVSVSDLKSDEKLRKQLSKDIDNIYAMHYEKLKYGQGYVAGSASRRY